MSQTRKPRSDSTAAAVEAARMAQQAPIKPPAAANLRKIDLPYFRSIVSSKPPSEWHETDLLAAGRLAKAMADIQTLEAELEIEPKTIGFRVNPKFKMIEALNNRVLALSRALQINSRAKNGEMHTLKNSRLVYQQAVNVSSTGVELDEFGRELLI